MILPSPNKKGSKTKSNKTSSAFALNWSFTIIIHTGKTSKCNSASQTLSSHHEQATRSEMTTKRIRFPTCARRDRGARTTKDKRRHSTSISEDEPKAM